jgi:hypothetical protein
VFDLALVTLEYFFLQIMQNAAPSSVFAMLPSQPSYAINFDDIPRS